MGRHKKKREQKGLRVDVRNNNVEWALKKLKRMVKNSGQILELKKRDYYKKPSAVKRERGLKSRCKKQQCRMGIKKIKKGGER